MTLKLAPLPDLSVDEFDVETAPVLGGPGWTEVCPVCGTLTAEPMFENVFCHSCNRFREREVTQ